MDDKIKKFQELMLIKKELVLQFSILLDKEIELQKEIFIAKSELNFLEKDYYEIKAKIMQLLQQIEAIDFDIDNFKI